MLEVKSEGRRVKAGTSLQELNMLPAHIKRQALKGNCEAIGFPTVRGLAANGKVWLEGTGSHLFSLSDNLAHMQHVRKQGSETSCSQLTST